MKNLLFFSSLLLFFACGKKQEIDTVNKSAVSVLNYTDLPSFIPLTASADSVLLAWPNFKAFEERIKALPLVVSVPDLKMLVQELIEKDQIILNEVYPEALNFPEIKSRQRVITTFLLKTRAEILLSQDPKLATQELVQSFNALRDQINLLTSPKLNLNTFEDDY
jgi:hypothetical protein